MARREDLILLDTSVLLAYFRNKNKSKTLYFQLLDKGYSFCISSVVYYELFFGAKDFQIAFLTELIERFQIFPFDLKAAHQAVHIQQKLKTKNQQIHVADLFIAATALANNLPLATLNLKHFERIEGLETIEFT